MVELLTSSFLQIISTPYLKFIISISIFIVSAYFIDIYVRRNFLRFKTKDNEPLRIPFYLFIFTIGLNFSFQYSNIFELSLFNLSNVLSVISILLSAYLINQISKSYIADFSVQRKMESLSVKILQRFSTWSVFLISFSLILSFIGYDITTYIPIFILLFAIFVIMLFASWSTLSNVISGFIILLWKPFKEGDVISIDGTNYSGEVQHIDLMFCKLLNQNDGIINFPNSLVFNYFTKVNSFNSIYPVKIEYTINSFTNIDKIKRALIHSAINTTNILSKPKPFVLIQQVQNEEVVFELNAFSNKYSLIEKTKSSLRFNFIKELKDLNKTKSTRRQSSINSEEITY